MDHKLTKQVSNYVRGVTKGRGDIHGFKHMETVAQNSLTIMLHMNLTRAQRRWAHMVSWLHDVANHKYDTDGKLQHSLDLFVCSIDPNNAVYIIKCIKMISYSEELKNGHGYYNNKLPKDWVIVRNIASDSDKLEAIGLNGIKRCGDYAQFNTTKQLTHIQKTLHIWEYSKYKLLNLYPRYIHTQYGKMLAKPLHEIMIEWFKQQGLPTKFLKQYKLTQM